DVALPAAILRPLASERHDPLGHAENGLGRSAAEQDQDLRREQLDLPGKEWRTGLDLFGCRRAVAGGTPIDGVGDVDMLLGKPDRLQHAVEQLPGASDEGLAAEVFVTARRLADQHDARFVAAALEAQALRRALEWAAVEGGHHRLERR